MAREAGRPVRSIVRRAIVTAKIKTGAEAPVFMLREAFDQNVFFMLTANALWLSPGRIVPALKPPSEKRAFESFDKFT